MHFTFMAVKKLRKCSGFVSYSYFLKRQYIYKVLNYMEVHVCERGIRYTKGVHEAFLSKMVYIVQMVRDQSTSGRGLPI